MRLMLLAMLFFATGCYAEGEITAKIKDVDAGEVIEGPVVDGRKLPDYKRVRPTRYYFEVSDYETGNFVLVEVAPEVFGQKEVGNWYAQRSPYD